MSDIDDVTLERDKLRSALAKERNDHKAARELLKQSRNVVSGLQTQLDTAAVVKDPSSERISSYLASAVQAQLATATAPQLARIVALEAELAEAKTAAETIKTTMATKTIEQEIRDACVAHKVLPTAINDVVTLGKLALKTLDNGAVETEDGLSAADYVDSLKATSPYYWPTSKGSGHAWADESRSRGSMGPIGGVDMPGMGGNPFDPASSAWNLTKQGEIFTADPTKAAQLQVAAG